MKRIPTFGILISFLILLFPHDGLTLTRNISSEIESKLEDFITHVYLPASGTGSLGIAIVGNNGEQVYTAGFGMADHARNIKNGNGTQFLIGSVTKSFTSLVVVKTLHDKFPELGEKVLDTPIRKLSPQFNFTLSDKLRSEHVTFRDILAHRVCLARNDLPLMAEIANSTKEVLFRQRYFKEICGFRTEFQYNNQMYVVAGELIGKIAEQPFEDLAADVLVAIGMLNSTFVKHSDDFSQMSHRAMPYYIKDNVSHPMNPELVKRVVVYNAAGGLFVTPNDMGKYLMLHLNSGKIHNEQVIPAEPMRWLTNPAIHISGFATFKSSESDIYISTSAYGLGLLLGSYNGWEYYGHGGYFPPYSSQLSLYPGLKIGIFLTSNEGPVQLPASSVLETFIIETLRASGKNNATEEAMKIWDKFQKEKALIQNSTSTPEINQSNQTFESIYINSTELVGEYGHEALGEILISERLNNPQKNTTQLYYSYGKWDRGWLKPWIENSSFEIEYDTDIIQDVYATGGLGEFKDIVKFGNNGTLECISFATATLTSTSIALFRRGVNLSTSPEIPWADESCAPGRMK